MESEQPYRGYQANNNSSFWEPKYFLIAMIFLLVIYFFVKNSSYRQEPIKDRVWRKLAFSYQELMNTFDNSEKELLKHTFHNTIFNTKPALITEDIRKQSKKKQNVQFNLDKNETHLYESNGF